MPHLRHHWLNVFLTEIIQITIISFSPPIQQLGIDTEVLFRNNPRTNDMLRELPNDTRMRFR